MSDQATEIMTQIDYEMRRVSAKRRHLTILTLRIRQLALEAFFHGAAVEDVSKKAGISVDELYRIRDRYLDNKNMDRIRHRFGSAVSMEVLNSMYNSELDTMFNLYKLDLNDDQMKAASKLREMISKIGQAFAWRAVAINEDDSYGI